MVITEAIIKGYKLIRKQPSAGRGGRISIAKGVSHDTTTYGSDLVTYNMPQI